MGVEQVQGRTWLIPPCAPVRQHPTRALPSDLRRRNAPGAAGQQPGQLRDAGLPPPGRRLPVAAVPGDEDGRRALDRVHHLHAADRRLGDARRRQRRRRRRRVGQHGEERPDVRGARERHEGPHPDHRIRDGPLTMSMFGALDVSASGLSAERMRMDVTAENLANAQTTRTANGGPYRRKDVVLQTATGDGFSAALSAAAGSVPGARSGQQAGGVQVTGIVEDQTAPRRIYDPGHPDADAQGYVSMPNVNPVTEMVDLIASSRAYEANVTAMQTAKQMFTKTFDILR